MLKSLRKKSFATSQFVPYQRFSTSFNKTIFNNAAAPYKLEEVIHNFRIKRVEYFPDYNITAYTLNHLYFGCEYYHLHTNDLSNTFAFIFNTLPSDNKGKAHLLERLICCGSKKYPVRDVFSHMGDRSFNTNLTPSTGLDHTTYSFNTHSKDDYYNLLEVYIESIFRPRLTKEDFLNEGWHYDFSEKGNTGSDMIVKGIVYNQMKGHWQVAENIFLENIRKNLFPDTQYSFCSGGTHDEIQKLTYEEILKAHNELYNPNNVKFFSYGDMDLSNHLKFLQEKLLAKAEESQKKNEKGDSLPKNISVSCPKQFEHPIEVLVKTPPDVNYDENERQSKIGVSFLCNDTTQNHDENVALSILSYALFETLESPFYKEFLESGMCDAFCPGYGYDASGKYGTFTIGVERINDNKMKIHDIEDIMMKKLKTVSDDGFDSAFIEKVMHDIEVNSRLVKKNFGETILSNLTPLLNNDCQNPLTFLKVSENFRSLRKKILEEGMLQDLIKKYFLNNNHKVRIIMEPDNYIIRDQIDDERRDMVKLAASLGQQDKNLINEQSSQIEKTLETIQDFRILPMLTLDLLGKGRPAGVKYEKTEVMGSKVYWIEPNIKGLSTLRIKFNTDGIPEKVRDYLHFFTLLLPKLGTKSIPFMDFNDLINRSSANFNLEYETNRNPENPEKIEEFITLSLSFLDQNSENMFNFLTELFCGADFFDYNNLSHVLRFYSSEMGNSLVEDSLNYALSYSASGMQKSIALNEQLKNVRNLCQYWTSILKTTRVEHLMRNLGNNLQAIMNFIMNKNKMTFYFHSNKSNQSQLEKRLNVFLKTLSLSYKDFEKTNESPTSSQGEFQEKLFKTHFVMPMSVNYVVETFKAPIFAHPDTPNLRIMAELLSRTILQREIEDIGGAFSGGCYYSHHGYFSLYSFRDPRTLQTYQTFEKACHWASKGSFTEQELNEAKLAVLNKIEGPEDPFDVGIRELLYGFGGDKEYWVKYREGLLAAKPEDIKASAKNYMLEAMAKERTSQVIFGGQKNNLEGFLSRGWKIERPADDISVEEGSYSQNKKLKPDLRYLI